MHNKDTHFFSRPFVSWAPTAYYTALKCKQNLNSIRALDPGLLGTPLNCLQKPKLYYTVLHFLPDKTRVNVSVVMSKVGWTIMLAASEIN